LQCYCCEIEIIYYDKEINITTSQSICNLTKYNLMKFSKLADAKPEQVTAIFSKNDIILFQDKQKRINFIKRVRDID